MDGEAGKLVARMAEEQRSERKVGSSHGGKVQQEIRSYWPPVIGLSVGVLATGIILFLRGAAVSAGLLLVAYFALLIFGFLYSEVRRWSAVAAKSPAGILRTGIIRGLPHFPVGLPVAIFLLTEVMIFAGAFGMYFYLRSSLLTWPPPGAPHLDDFIPRLQTLDLIASSLMIEWALSQVRRGNQKGLKIGAVGSTILGAMFSVLQLGFEYPYLLFNRILTPQDGFFGASFYLLTGFHGAHVIGGVICFSIVSIRALLGQFSERNHDFVEATATYWHFVHIVWLFLFAFIWQGGLTFKR